MNARYHSLRILLKLSLALIIIIAGGCSTTKKLQKQDVLPGIDITFTGEQVADTVYVTISPIPSDTNMYVKDYVEVTDNGRAVACPVIDRRVHIIPDSEASIYKIACDYYSLPSYYLRNRDHLDMTISSLSPANYNVTGGIYSKEIPFTDEFYKLRGKLHKISRYKLTEQELDSLSKEMYSLIDRMMDVSEPETATRIVTQLEQDFVPYAFNRLPDGSENTLYYSYASAIRNTASLTESQQKMVEESLENSAPTPDIILNCLDGEVFNVSSLRGKWVVIDFWTTWCGPCKKGFEKMKKLYSANSDKIEVVAIACGDHEDTWREMVEKLELPWVNLLASAPDVNNGTVAGFPVPSYPTKIVIDPEGRLCDYVIGETEDFYEKLERLIK